MGDVSTDLLSNLLEDSIKGIRSETNTQSEQDNLSILKVLGSIRLCYMYITESLKFDSTSISIERNTTLRNGWFVYNKPCRNPNLI